MPVRELGPLVFQAAAKGRVRVNTDNAVLYGVLDNSFRRLSADEPRTNPGGDEWANDYRPGTSSPGQGHDVAFWTEFLRALQEVDPDMLLYIEHEDTELGRIEGLEVAAAVLKDADAQLVKSADASAEPLPDGAAARARGDLFTAGPHRTCVRCGFCTRVR